MTGRQQKVKWTASQRQAIETIGRPVLVAASAGTGKTAVLSGRVVGRIADPNDSAQADSVLVLTFTDAAAEEMRQRIAHTLAQHCRHAQDSRLNRQLLLLDRAAISTIHAFCKRILTEFFYMADLDPAFGILDADEQKLLKSEVLDETLESAWADSDLSTRLTELFNGRRIQPGLGSFVDRIIPLSEFLDSVISRETFYARAAAANNPSTDAYRQLAESQRQIMLELLDQCRGRLEHAIRLDAAFCGGSYASGYIQNELVPAVEQCKILLEQGRFDLCRGHLEGLEFGRLPAFKKNQWPEECKDLIKGPIDKVREKIKDLSNFALLCQSYGDRIAPHAAAQSATLLDLVRRFDQAYAKAKRQRNVLDFADLEHRLLWLLQNRPQAAASLQDRYSYILVDEYQDINAVQQAILERLRRPDNLFVVGDVKQSIYGFRQSKPEIFLEQLQAAVDADTLSANACRIDLKENFRCRSEIIEFVNFLFSRIMTEKSADMTYDARAHLVSGLAYPPFAAQGGPAEPVELVLLDEDAADEEAPAAIEPFALSVSASQRQAAWIARRIRQLVGADTQTPELHVLDKKTGEFRSVEYRDIVILMRSLSHKARDYVEMLRLAQVPVSSQSACGYFEAAEVTDCLCLLKVLDNPDRDIELAALLRSPIFNVTDTGLAEIRLYAEEKLRSGRKHVGFYEAVRAYSNSGPDLTLRQQSAQILSTISQWRQEARGGSLADLLDKIFRDHHLLSFYAALPNGQQRRANLLKLHDHAIQFEHFRTTDPGTSLSRFVEFLEKLTDEGQDWAPAEPDSAGENAVRIMSVHKSKGLEFPVVFVAELNTRFNMKDAAGECLISEDAIGLQILDSPSGFRYPSMSHQVIADQRRKTDLAEEMRILYVALTRAREKLILVGSRKQESCVELLRQAAAMGSALPDWRLTDSSCHLDWLLGGLGTCRSLHRLYGTGAAENLIDAKFHVHRLSRDHLEETACTILQDKRALKSITQAQSAAGKSTVTFEHIRHNLQWRYPYEQAVEINAKASVSELVHHGGMADAAFAAKPAAVCRTDAGGTSAKALALGSAFHLLFESLDLHKAIDAGTVRTALERLIAAGRITEDLAAGIDTSAVLSFFASRLGQLAVANPGKVLREWPFTYGLIAAEAAAGCDGESIILQGIVDLIIPTEKGLVIVDFKSDRVSQAQLQERSSLYADQLRYYAQAAAAILRQPAIECWLYFLGPRMPVQVAG